MRYVYEHAGTLVPCGPVFAGPPAARMCPSTPWYGVHTPCIQCLTHFYLLVLDLSVGQLLGLSSAGPGMSMPVGGGGAEAR